MPFDDQNNHPNNYIRILLMAWLGIAVFVALPIFRFCVHVLSYDLSLMIFIFSSAGVLMALLMITLVRLLGGAIAGYMAIALFIFSAFGYLIFAQEIKHSLAVSAGVYENSNPLPQPPEQIDAHTKGFSRPTTHYQIRIPNDWQVATDNSGPYFAKPVAVINGEPFFEIRSKCFDTHAITLFELAKHIASAGQGAHSEPFRCFNLDEGRQACWVEIIDDARHVGRMVWLERIPGHQWGIELDVVLHKQGVEKREELLHIFSSIRLNTTDSSSGACLIPVEWL